MPTLYDNFERVRQYIDQHQADVDLSAYVSYAYLESKNYIDDNVNLLHGPLFVDYSTPQNDSYTLSTYSHIVAGTEDKTGVSFVATKRKCGGADGTTYMASFFINSDGRSKFAHKTKISDTGVGAQSDDAFMCFNAYGFRIAYSGTEGVSANTEYEILHEGNIGNLGYITSGDVAQMGYVTSSDLPVINENIVPKETATYTLGDTGYYYKYTYTYSLNINPNSRIYNDNLAVTITCNNLGFRFGANNFRPKSAGNYNLGESDYKWKDTYTTNIYADNAYISNYNNLIWTGTSAEYAALDNYTSYQIYMIKEA